MVLVSHAGFRYRTSDNVIDGVVITFTDISAQKNTKETCASNRSS